MKLQGQGLTGQASLGQLRLQDRQRQMFGKSLTKAPRRASSCLKNALGNLDNYAAHFLCLVKMYSQSVWYLAYQTEVRMRQERMEVIRRRGEAEHAAARAAGGGHAYNPLRPWDWVWAQSILDHQFWKQNFEAPALLVLTRTQSLSSMIDGAP